MLSEANLRDDLNQLLETDDASRWIVQQPTGLELWVTVHPRSNPAENFQARLLWTEYPGRPPSLKFRDPVSGRLDLVHAWPVVPGFRPTSFDACVNWVEEGFIAHPEWRNCPRNRWNGTGNALLRVVSQVQELLDWHYKGRAP